MTIGPIISWFLNSQIESKSLDSVIRARRIVFFSMVILGACIVYGSTYLMFGMMLSLLGAFIAFVFALLSSLMIRWKWSVQLAGHTQCFSVYSAITVISLVTGGLFSPVHAWHIMTVVCAGALLGRKAALSWSIISIITMVISFFLYQKDILWKDEIPDIFRDIYWLLVPVGLLLGIFAMVRFYEITQEKARLELGQYAEELNQTIEDLKQAQMRLIQHEKMASLGVLTAGVAHEINNPLNFIQTGLYGLKSLMPKTKKDESLSQVMDAMQEGVHRVSRIVKSLNNFSRQSPESEWGQIDLHLIIEDCLLILNNEIKDRISIKLDFDQNLEKIDGHESGLHQVFLNIIKNSIQAIEDKGEILISTKKEDQYAVVSVNDSGAGIDPQIIKKIFDPFFTTKPIGKGTGLGLSIVQSIIENHYGQISLLPKEEMGTTLMVRIPIKKGNA